MLVAQVEPKMKEKSASPEATETKGKPQERQKEPVLQESPEEIEIPPPYTPIYPPLPRPAPEESGSEDDEPQASPQKEKSEPLPQEVKEESQDGQVGCFRSGCTRALQMPLQETQRPLYYDEHGHIQGGQWTFVYQPFSTTDLLNLQHHTPSYMEKPQAIIDLMQSIFQTHNLTRPDCK